MSEVRKCGRAAPERSEEENEELMADEPINPTSQVVTSSTGTVDLGIGANTLTTNAGANLMFARTAAAPGIQDAVSFTVCGAGDRGPLCDATLRALAEMARRAAQEAWGR